MPSASELARKEAEDVEIEPATDFEITIQFGRHQMKHVFGKGAMRSARSISAELGKAIEPHIQAMLDAEERQHGR